MKTITRVVLLVFILSSLGGCSRKKNTFLNRNWHAVTAEYNTLYNGNLALDLGKEELIQTYQDNYWNILPVERMQLREEILLAGESENPNFKIAEEKAVKAIQRHSMLIDGQEQNPQIDEAYLLLGKARYYDQRFVPALEAFNYILHKYPLSDNINQAKIWREKSNIRLEFNEVALKNLKEILEQESLKEQDRADASAFLAQAYINLEEIDSAIAPIKVAAELTKNNDEKGRYLFIQGQLFDQLGMKDSANAAFNEIIALNRKSPRIYMMNAYIAKIQNSNNPEDKAAILQLLNELQEDRENRPFLDKIYFQLAEFHYQMDSIELAVDYYNRSLRQPSENSYLQSLDYQTLGNINFDAANYKLAGAYYDSTLLRLPENSREFRLIKRKRDNLDDVIYYEDIARSNDSILYVSSLSEEARIVYFTDYTEELKAAAIELAKQQTAGEKIATESFFDNSNPGIPGVPNPGNAFYFYNPTAVAYGKQQFFNIWGERQLADNWRDGNNFATPQFSDSTEVASQAFENNPLFDPQTYINQIPNDPETIEELRKERNFAYYQLGLIYRGKFNENHLAAERLEILLESNPEERLILPAKYNLYKIYNETRELAKAQAIKNEILFEYPNSRYAAILENPGAVIKDENDPDELYNELYAKFQKQEFQEVIAESQILIDQFTGDEIVPKLELLKAMSIGRLRGFEEYKEAVNYVALNYPQTVEGKKAQQIYSEALPKLASKQFQKDSAASSFKLIFPLKRTDSVEIKTLQQKLTTVLENSNYANLEISADVYNSEKVFVVIHGFNSRAAALGFDELLSKKGIFEVKNIPVVISSENYAILQIHKNLESYFKIFPQEKAQIISEKFENQ